MKNGDWTSKIEVWKNAVLKLHFKEGILKRVLLKGQLSFLSGLVEALKSGELHFWKWNLLRRKCRRWAYLFFSFDTLQALGSRQNPRSLEEDDVLFFTMRSKDSETTHLLGSGPVLRHNNACVRDVLTAPSNVYLNLGLNLFHSYFQFVFDRCQKPSRPTISFRLADYYCLL